MSQQSDSSASNKPKPAAAFPFAGVAPLAHGPETVVNPERRGHSSMSDTLPAPPPPLSGVWRRLFPSENDVATGAAEPPAGFTLEHFVIEERIGAGGMGAVFRAVDQRLQRVVALKVLAPFQSTDVSSVQRFQNEARAAARLDHDNIARVYYVGEDQGLQFIAFEYVTGTNVRDLIRRQGKLTPGEAVNYALQIAAALRHTAAAGVVHRDIKPSNIIITPNGRAKLVDLGLARKQNSESVGELTLAGTTLGTFDYISPEQAKDPRNVDVRSDIYSLGCTIYHMLAGEPPYPEGTVLQKLLDHQGKDPPDPAKKNRNVPPALTAVVQKMMASDPRRRYSTPDELIRDLMFVAGALGLRGVNPEGLVWSSARHPAAPFLERYGGWIATVAALLLLVLLIDRFPGLGQANRQDDLPEHRNATQGERRNDLASRGAVDATIEPGVAAVEPSRGSRGNTSANGNESLTAVGSEAPAFVASRTSNGGMGLSESAGANASPSQPVDDSKPIVQFPLVQPRSVFNDTGLPPLFESSEPPASPETPGTTRIVPDVASRTGSGPAVAINSASPSPPPPETVTQPSAPSFPPMAADPPAISLVTGSERKGYPTLEGACAQATDGSVIELNYNGSRGETDRPLRVANKRVIIRAGKGFRPLIEFEPKEIPAQGVEARMITVENGQIDLINVDIQVRVRDTVELPSDQIWSLCLLQGFENERVRLEGASVTFINPASRPAAVFEMASGVGRTLSKMKMMTMGEDAVRPRFQIDLVECLVRGGTDLFHVRHTLPGDLTVERSAVAVEGAMLRVLGDLESADSALLNVRLNYATAVVGEGLIRLETGDQPRKVLPVFVTARNNIFATNTSHPLVAMEGNTNPDDFRQSLRWNGENNCYDRFETLWAIRTPQASEPLISLGFEDWKNAWSQSTDTYERNARIEGLAWQGQWTDHESAEVVPADLELDRSVANNPAVASATDGTSDLGAPLNRLPTPFAAE